MNTRLVWNFEINNDKPLAWPAAESSSVDDIRWESRFFWPGSTIITLNGLDDTFLELSRYQVKHRQDSYYLLADEDYNLKTRHEHLLYKPIIKKTEHAVAYGKKLNLAEQSPDSLLPGHETLTAKTLLHLIRTRGKKIHVEKEALIYKFATTPVTKLEFARLTVKNKTYFSVSIESRAIAWIELLTQHLLGKEISCDYVTFLKTI